MSSEPYVRICVEHATGFVRPAGFVPPRHTVVEPSKYTCVFCGKVIPWVIWGHSEQWLCAFVIPTERLADLRRTATSSVYALEADSCGETTRRNMTHRPTVERLERIAAEEARLAQQPSGVRRSRPSVPVSDSPPTVKVQPVVISTFALDLERAVRGAIGVMIHRPIHGFDKALDKKIDEALKGLEVVAEHIANRREIKRP